MKKSLFKVSLVMVLVALFVSSCAAPAETVEVPVEVTRIVEGETVVEEIIVTATPVPEEQEAYRIAFVAPSSVTDMAHSQALYEALLKIQEEMGGESALEIAYSEGMFKIPMPQPPFATMQPKAMIWLSVMVHNMAPPLPRSLPTFPKPALPGEPPWTLSRRRALRTCSPTRLNLSRAAMSMV